MSLALRAVAFAAGAAAVGFVVLPTVALLSAGATPSQVVIARLFWGAGTLLLISLLLCPARLRRSPRAHVRLCGTGLLLGWATVELYTRALESAAVQPVIVLLVAASAVTGMLAQLGARVRTGHVFVLLAVVVSVGATVYAARPALDLQVDAVAFAIGAGALYGALPVLCRNAGRSPDIAAVALYLSYGTLWAVAVSVIFRGESLGETAAIALAPEALIAGVFCTGLAYALFQVGLCPDRHGRRLGSTWAALLYGFEPISAILVAGLFLGQVVSMAGLIFAGAFLMLVTLAGPTLTQLTGAKA